MGVIKLFEHYVIYNIIKLIEFTRVEFLPNGGHDDHEPRQADCPGQTVQRKEDPVQTSLTRFQTTHDDERNSYLIKS